MTARTNIAHNSGRKPAQPRKRPRHVEPAEHVDKYADDVMAEKLAQLVAHFNGGRQ